MPGSCVGILGVARAGRCQECCFCLADTFGIIVKNLQCLHAQ